ncbi:MAG: deoxyuridine 5'-triphosphate nucleotidohydrolase [bacterium]|nr:deoxyuridine 5'-triphosphate nucleotidohydrolase [bacterium]
MNRFFEKISLEQFKKDTLEDELSYNSVILPKRSTKNSAGYDFYSFKDYIIPAGKSLKIPLAIKAYMNNDEVLLLMIRSSLGFKYNIRMSNQIGVIDSDYYNNENNEGHIWIKLYNSSKKDFIIKKGEKIIQGIFIKYLTVDGDDANNKRTGGLGSTGKGEL